MTGRVGESNTQSRQEISAWAAADGVNPGQSRVHCVRSTGAHVAGPAGHLQGKERNLRFCSSLKNVLKVLKAQGEIKKMKKMKE